MASRRTAEAMILEGRVQVNGATVRDLGGKYDPAEVEIKVDGKTVGTAEEHVYFLLNKPKGYFSTVHDERGRRTVLDLLPEVRERIYPIGRLDANTEGLLLLTNDGQLMNGLLHPRYEVDKTYVARLDEQPTEKELDRLRQGIELEDGMTSPAWVQLLSADRGRVRIELTIHEGRNRQVRRMFEALGYDVKALKRTGFAGLSLKDIPRGKYRALTAMEIQALYEKTGLKA